MNSRIRSHLSFANVISLLALFIALGGTSYAILKLPKNSVGARQIERDAVRSGEVKDASLKAGDFRAGELPRGATGPSGPMGTTGPSGPAGKDLVLNTPLASGQTDRGVWAVGGGNGDNLIYAIQFHAPLAAPLDSAHTIRVAGNSGPHCPGPGQAEAGYFCLYERSSTATFQSISDPATGASGVSTLGAQVAYIGAGSNVGAVGTWAVTAP